MANRVPTYIDSTNKALTRINAGTDTIDPTAGGTGQVAITAGDILYGSASNVWSRLAAGATGYALTIAAGVPAWAVLGVAGGGTGIASYTSGDILYATGASTLAKRGIGSTGDILTVSGGLPVWAAPTGAVSKSKTNGDGSSITIGEVVYVKSDGNVKRAQANSSSTWDAWGVALATVADTASASFQYAQGSIVTLTTGEWDAVAGTTGGLSPGTKYYLSEATAGRWTASPSSTAGNALVLLGIADTSTTMKLILEIVAVY